MLCFHQLCSSKDWKFDSFLFAKSFQLIWTGWWLFLSYSCPTLWRSGLFTEPLLQMNKLWSESLQLFLPLCLGLSWWKLNFRAGLKCFKPPPGFLIVILCVLLDPSSHWLTSLSVSVDKKHFPPCFIVYGVFIVICSNSFPSHTMMWIKVKTNFSKLSLRLCYLVLVSHKNPNKMLKFIVGI